MTDLVTVAAISAVSSTLAVIGTIITAWIGRQTHNAINGRVTMNIAEVAALKAKVELLEKLAGVK